MRRNLLILCPLLLGALAPAADIVSGPPIGATTMSIPVSDVTGPYKGTLVCYVCDYDKAPDVLAFFRDTSDATAKEIIQLNDLYLKNKSRNFHAVAMIIAGESSKQWLEDLNKSAHLEIPLTYFRKGPRDPAVRVYNLNPAVGNTFLVTVNRSVVANFSDVAPDQFKRVADATSQMLAGLH
ncbi:MAG TPA: hypothetical protein VMB25_08565 [Bryobacteraceae bacterium]|nr:hypothetical protein [Bryobacteraceae bacterium]